MAKIIFSGFADEYSRDPHSQIEGLNTLGFTHIEPRFIGEKNVSELTEDEARVLREKLDAAGISVYSVGSPLGKIPLDGDFDAHLVLAEQVFKVANILGATRIRMFSFYLPDGKSCEECRDLVIARLGAMLDLADKYGLVLCHENEHGIYGENADRCLDLMRAFGGRLRAVFDMGNFVLDGVEPYPYAYGLLADYIDYFHIKDSLPEGAIVPPGLGKARIADILRSHLARGNDFVVSLEPHLQLFSGLNSLTGSKFENPYKFNSLEEAFLEAGRRLRDIADSL